MEDISKYIKDDEDIAFEYELQNDPGQLQTWVRYIDRWREQNTNGLRSEDCILWLFRRYVRQFMNNVDVWFVFINWVIDNRIYTDYNEVATIYEESIRNCGNKSEKLCVNFLKYTIETRDLSLIRKSFDLGLEFTSKHSHYKLWEQLLSFIKNVLISTTESLDKDEKSQIEQFGETISKVFEDDYDIDKAKEENNKTSNIWVSIFLERYLIVCPSNELLDSLTMLGGTHDYKRIKEQYDKYLFQNRDYTNLTRIKDFPYSLNLVYLRVLCELNDKSEYQRFVGTLKQLYSFNHTNLDLITAKYLMTNEGFEALEVHLDTLLQSTVNIEDFSKVSKFHFDFEEAIIDQCLNRINKKEVQNTKYNFQEVMKVHLEKLQMLTNDHSIKLNDLYLRKSPNNVGMWLRRVNHFQALKEKIDVYVQGILQIDPLHVKEPGTFGRFWCNYAQLYWDNKDYDSAREIFERALKVPFPYLKDLETIWFSWVEDELKLNDPTKACLLLEQALKIPDNPMAILEQYENSYGNIPTRMVVFHSLKLWTLYLDLLESEVISTLDKPDEMYKKTIQIYENMIRLKIITPLLFVSYARLVAKYESQIKSFQIYNRAISSFPPEIKYDIWLLYLNVAVRSTLSVEQVRDLFDESLSQLIPNQINCISIYLLNNQYEEKQTGVTQTTITKLVKSAKELSSKFVESKIQLWDLALERTKSHFGLEMARPLYEECITTIPRDKATEYVMSFANLEVALGEVVRAREVLRYGANLLPPLRNEPLWKYWEEFEITNGDKEKYKDMLKFKKKLDEEMKVNTEQVSQESGNIEFVASKTTTHVSQLSNNAPNPEEINLDL
ncbi:similar to Saccharomyces cerevisiae YDR416W SYF1 Member of the NineTeen Complex (NTC) that contains Prp19p and stabilizes U6 snRNA in catalytic forms of the spliceosome containing U2 [Maudiozyma saulgeensis]|uniref:Pre-mRNA-splicing factor SYF1 n=1 Tax=Maudiozyma saulgeensis TaxID=1789683 RepID=A0A1X7R1T6_9SACH|nr:similar to Saccharomyces cerevisiae YDR416W SYF1 Member of the NineTeen Complex (NTC) that contains Prp19p and stabilizes U6 snRNA in catalytic forms of the spliceosome containing U2 [Kazachstania saulgeensis]